jgi:outer membrane biogenesis lipoprotein LolB
MKNIFTTTLLSLLAILLATACTPAPRTPADTVEKVDAETLRKQADFDKAMIEKENIEN